MNIRTYLLATCAGTALALSSIAVSYTAETITTEAMKAPTSVSGKEATKDPRVAATSFVEHLNYARVALAMKNASVAKQHIADARTMATLIKEATMDQRLVTDVQTGRVVYMYDTEYKYHYFPIETGPVQVKQVSSGMMWAKNELAVTDADIVYLTLDLRGDKAETYLADAETAIAAGDMKRADKQLAMLTETVVSVESKTSMPSDKAHDNIALARNFIAAKNYEGARFALKHADEALDEMQKDEKYKGRSADLAMMRKDVAQIQVNITAKDPTMIEKTNAKMEKWWSELKTWSKKQ